MKVAPSPLIVPEITEIQSVHPADIPSFYETRTSDPVLPALDEGDLEATGPEDKAWFKICFYALSVLLGILVVQVIWQIAWVTAP
jgi:hypothetical protein